MSEYFTIQRVEQSVQYLADSEQEYARLRAAQLTEKKRLEIELASLVEESTQKSQNAKENDAKTTDRWLKAVEMYHDVLESFYLLDAKRHRAETIVEVWRSVNASRGRGNIT